MHVADFAAAMHDGEVAAVVGAQLRAPVEHIAVQAEGFHRRPATHFQHFGQVLVFAVDDQAPATRHRAHEMVELALDGRDIGKDVRVVEFEVVQDRDRRLVVHELRALVEERRVVFVGLDHELAAGAHARGHAEVLRHAADQEARRAAGVFEQPGEDRGRRGLAVRAGDGERFAAGQHAFAQPLRAGDVAAAFVEHLLDRGIAARERVADDDFVAIVRNVFGRVALAQRDAELLELRRHRRIDRLVAAFDLMPEFARERGDAAHEGAGDAEDVDFQGRGTSKQRLPCGAQPTSLTGAIASRMRVNTSSSEPTPSTAVSWPCWR